MDRDDFKSMDLLSNEPFDKPFDKRKWLKRGILVVAIVCAIVLTITLSLVPESTFLRSAVMHNFQQKEYLESKGKQAINKGCVALYNADYRVYPNTRAVVVCNR